MTKEVVDTAAQMLAEAPLIPVTRPIPNTLAVAVHLAMIEASYDKVKELLGED